MSTRFRLGSVCEQDLGLVAVDAVDDMLVGVDLGHSKALPCRVVCARNVGANMKPSKARRHAFGQSQSH